MGANLTKTCLSDFEQRFVNDSSFAARPLAHAMWRSRLIELGG
jgi:hypothetical protein